MKSPWRNRAAIKSPSVVVVAQKKPQSATTDPPTRMMDLIGYRSANMPKGRLDRAIPRMTAETVKEVQVSLAPNSLRRIGSTG